MKKIFLLLIVLILTTTKEVYAYDTSHSSIVMDTDSKRILYENNIHEKKLIASTTKILTAIVVLENTDINKKITIGEEVLKMYGTNIYVEVGEKIKIKDLLYGLLLRSGNDSAVALAVATSKTEEEFVKLMNKKAQTLGMKNSIFENPHGLDEETKNYSTAHDMALLSSYASKNKTYQEIVNTRKYESKTNLKTYLWYNRNKLLTKYEYCTGGKNGYTPSAGRTLVTTASKNNLNLTVVTLDDQNEYDTHQNLYEKIYNKYQNYEIVNKHNFKIDKNFYNGKVYIKESFSYPLTKEELNNIKTIVEIKNKNTNKNKIGKIKIYLSDKKIKEITIYGKQKEEKNSLLSKIKSLILR